MQKKVPIRLCAGCGIQKPKRELVRVVKTPEGEIALDLTGKKSGRGAYICKDVECLKKAKKTKRLERVFESSIPEDVYLAIEEEMAKSE